MFSDLDHSLLFCCVSDHLYHRPYCYYQKQQAHSQCLLLDQRMSFPSCLLITYMFRRFSSLFSLSGALSRFLSIYVIIILSPISLRTGVSLRIMVRLILKVSKIASIFELLKCYLFQSWRLISHIWCRTISFIKLLSGSAISSICVHWTLPEQNVPRWDSRLVFLFLQFYRDWTD